MTEKGSLFGYGLAPWTFRLPFFVACIWSRTLRGVLTGE